MSCHKPTLEALQQQGLRLTAQRALILEDLYHHPGHRTAENIYDHVSDRLPGLNRATVYRTLEMLRNAGVVTSFNGPEGTTEFELIGVRMERHHHLICQTCGAECGLDAAPIERLKSEINAFTGFQADLNHLVIYGLCARCAASGHTNTPHTEGL